MTVLSLEEGKKLLQSAKKPSKYRNKKVKTEGQVFDSVKEYRRYQTLKLLEKAGEIQNLKTQVKFELIVGGMLICKYYADFTYTDRSGCTIVEDVKSDPTRKLPVYKLKKRLLKAIHNYDINEI